MTRSGGLFSLQPREKKRVPEESIVELKEEILDADDYRLKTARTRNVLFAGRPNSGASTALGVLKNPTFLPSKLNLFSDRDEATLNSFAVSTGGENNETIALNIIKSPGLKQVAPLGSTPRDDDLILNSITTCLQNSITSIHCLVIFVSFEAGITSDDIECFHKYFNSFYHEDLTVLVCVTRAEDKDDEWKANLEDQLKRHAEFSDFVCRSNVRIVYMGCVDEHACRNAQCIEDLSELYREVFFMRKDLLESIFRSENAVQLDDIPAAKASYSKARRLLQEKLMDLRRLDEMKECDTASAQQLIHKIYKEDKALKEVGALISLNDDEVLEDLMEVKRLTRSIVASGRLGDSSRSLFVRDLLGERYHPPAAQPSRAAIPPAVQEPAIPPVVQAPAIPPVVQAPAIPPVVQAPAIPPVVQAPAISPVVEAPAISPVVEAPAIPPAVQEPAIPPVVQAPAIPPAVQEPAIPPVVEEPVISPAVPEAVQEAVQAPPQEPAPQIPQDAAPTTQEVVSTPQ